MADTEEPIEPKKRAPRKTKRDPELLTLEDREDAKMTPRQRVFARVYSATRDARQAAMAAGYATESDSAHVQRKRAWAALRSRAVRKSIRRRDTQRLERLELEADRVLVEVGRIAFADIRSVVQVKNGHAVIRDTAELTEAQAAAISEIAETKTGGLRVKLHDKTKALDMLARTMALYAPERVAGQLQVQQVPPSDMTTEELHAEQGLLTELRELIKAAAAKPVTNVVQ